MAKKVAPLNINTNQVVTMINKGTIALDNPYQRPSGQWKRPDQSLLIDSLVTFFMPDVTAIKEKRIIDGKELNVYDIVDGKQRLTTINDYKNDGFKLSNLPPFTLETDGEDYDISGLLYSELPKPVKDAIDSYTFSIRPVELEEGDDKAEVSKELTLRLNNGVKMSAAHLALVASKEKTNEYVQEKVTNHSLLTTSAHFAVGSIKNSEPQMAVLQSLALVGGYEWKSFGTADIKKLFTETDVEPEVLDETSKVFDFLLTIFPEYTKFVTKVFLPVCVSLVVNNNFDPKLKDFLQDYVITNKKNDSYRRYGTGGTTKRDTVENRINGLQKLYEDYVNEHSGE